MASKAKKKLDTGVQPPALRHIVSASEKIKVAVRVRPCGKGERGGQVTADPTTGVICCVGGAKFTFDYAFDEKCQQKTVYVNAVAPLVDTWVTGYNASIFAYGQTGSGKTFTMLGPDGGHADLDGVIPQVADSVFDEISREQAVFASTVGCANMSQYQVRASYVEVYNDDVRDLLGKDNPPAVLQVRENASGRVYVEGAREVPVESTKEVLACIKAGSKRRATGRTNMNEHSSRSHAVFTLVLEHRWRQPGCDLRQYKCKTSYFNLIDLAGSEQSKRTGNKDTAFRESISINSGLLALGKVIAALSGNENSHVPYRDSTLTRLLQSSLGGDSRTVMLACVSPAEENFDETVGTLRYAQSARSIKVAPKQHIEVVTEEAGPMDNDIVDPDRALDRRCLWIDTQCCGSIFARCVGDPADPLILLIHGSGPTNSSTWWNGLVHELAVTGVGEGNPVQSFFMVAIDCPGYGRSVGDRQDIRSTPGAVVRDVVHALGRSKCFALVGSSQGACATFNAVLEFPSITDFIVVMDPVGHDVFRYKQIQQPCLLIFDVDDDGHPVKVGRWMRDNLPKPHYFEFSSRRTPYWHVDNMATEMLNMFREWVGKAKGVKTKLSRLGAEGTGSMMTRLAGGLVKWCENMGYGEPIKQIDEGLVEPPSQFLKEMLGEEVMRQLSVNSNEDDHPSSGDGEWVAKADPSSGKVYYHNLTTGETSWKAPKGMNESHAPCAPGGALPDMFQEEDDEEEEPEESENERLERERAEREKTVCDICEDVLWKPVRMPICRHVICWMCHLRSSNFTKKCPTCGETAAGAVTDDVHHALLLEMCGAAQLEARRDRDKKEEHDRDTSMRIILEYGNTAEGMGGEVHTVEAFMQVAKVEKGKLCKRALPDKGRIIARVDFDINPSYPKAAIKVAKAPFTLTRTMASLFPCNMTVRWAESSFPPVTIPYTVSHDKRTTSRVAVILPSSGPLKNTKDPVKKSWKGLPEVRIG
eukprot:Sspe_Gene.11089::Locus_3738_Transcript_2_2_Confidence_0.750_Length_3089::g.11089::m.11089/K10395/KIF4_21_27; kinesin family member 4/21/27